MLLFKYFKLLLNDKNIIKSSLKLAIPIMIQTLVVSSVNLIDNLMVGMLGDASLSAVVSANKYYSIISFTVNSSIAACIIFLAQYNGANNIKKMKESFRFSIVAAYFLLTISFLIVFIFPTQLIKFIIDDEAIILEGAKYLRLAAFSYLPMGITMCISGSLRAIGDSKTPMIASIISIIINAILDYMLIFGFAFIPSMGVEGAAIATIIARIVEAMMLFIVLKRNNYPFDSRIVDLFDFSNDLAKNIIIKALPIAINEIFWQFGMTVLLKAYSFRGSTINSAYSIAITVSDIFFILFSGMAVASTVLIGTPLGANKIDEARDNGYKIIVLAVILSVFFGGGLFLSSFFIHLIYPNVSQEALMTAKIFLRCMGLMYWLYMFNAQCYFTLRAGGDTKSTLFMDSGFMWCVNIPLVLLLAYKTNINVYLVYLIGQSTDILKSFISFSMVKKEKWIKNLTTK